MQDRREQISTVSEVNRYIKNMFVREYALNRVCVQGEISNCKYHSSGHIYFTLKDRGGAIACVMFAGNRKGLNFRMTEGMAVIVFGSVSVYERDGRYQLYAREIMQEGAGKLYEAYEALKKKLLAEGLFDEEHKQDIPKYPKRLGVVTARTGAAVQDIINVSLRRNPWLQIVFCPATVQGEGAAQSVVRGIHALEEAGVDVMIVGRGGGSIEDLWAFNEEMVARAVYNCKIPVISAVGHETDTTIIDYVADLRAPTPSAAAELAVPDMRIVLGQLQGYEEALEAAMEQIVALCRQRVDSYARVFRHLNPQSRLNDRRQRLMEIEDRLRLGMERRIEQAKSELAIRTQQLEGVSPLRQLERGYAYVSDEDGHGVASAEQVTVGQHLFLDVKDGMIESEVTAIQKQKR